MQVDPIEPKVKPPGSERLKLKCDVLLSNAAFKFNLRRYSMDDPSHPPKARPGRERSARHVIQRILNSRR